MLGPTLAVCAGVCGAMAATCAKLAMEAQSAQAVCSATVLSATRALPGTTLFIDPENTLEDFCSSVLLYVRFSFFGLIFLFNALMWTFFVKSLQKCSSSIEASLTNTGANIFFTAVIGWLLFGEALSLTWWVGASLIVSGLALIQHANPGEQDSRDKKTS